MQGKYPRKFAQKEIDKVGRFKLHHTPLTDAKCYYILQ